MINGHAHESREARFVHMLRARAARSAARAQKFFGAFLAIRQLNPNIQNTILKVAELRVPPPRGPFKSSFQIPTVHVFG